MITTGHRRPTYFVSHIKKICIWHQRFGYASNVKIIRASKLLDGISNLSGQYDPAEIYKNFEASDVEEYFNSLNDSNPQNLKSE